MGLPAACSGCVAAWINQALNRSDIIATIGPVPAIIPLSPTAGVASGADAALPGVPAVMRAQLVGVSLATFADGRAEAMLTRMAGVGGAGPATASSTAAQAASGQGYRLTFPATGQTLVISSEMASKFIAPGENSALVQFELVGETASGNPIARATLVVPPLVGAAPSAAAQAFVETSAQAPAKDLASISGAAQQLATLSKLAPLNGAAWVSARAQLVNLAQLQSPQSAQDAFAQALRDLLPSLGIGYERALARAVMCGDDGLKVAMSRFAQAGTLANVDPARSGSASIRNDPAEFSALSAQQLLAGEQGSAPWRGLAWPGAATSIEIGVWREHGPATDEVRREMRDLLPAEFSASAWLRMAISPPALGPLEIFAAYVPNQGAWARIKTDNPVALQQLSALHTTFSAQLAEARVRVAVQMHTAAETAPTQ